MADIPRQPLSGQGRPSADFRRREANTWIRLGAAVRIWRTNVGACRDRSVSASRVRRTALPWNLTVTGHRRS